MSTRLGPFDPGASQGAAQWPSVTSSGNLSRIVCEARVCLYHRVVTLTIGAEAVTWGSWKVLLRAFSSESIFPLL